LDVGRWRFDVGFSVRRAWPTAITSWRVVLKPDPEIGDWAAWCPELPGCASAGETTMDAVVGIKEVIALYLETSI
jgi:predicted RNase H-like HicB family nuclease